MKSPSSREKKAVIGLLTVLIVAVLLSWVFSGGCGPSDEYAVQDTPVGNIRQLPPDTASFNKDSLNSKKIKKNTRKSDKKLTPHKSSDFAPSSPLEHPVKHK